MILSLALRNLTRNRRRSLFTILAIAIGFIAINLFAGYILNVFSGLQTSAIRGESLGHLTLAKRGYFSHGSMDKEGYMFSGTELSALIQRMPESLYSPPAGDDSHLRGYFSWRIHRSSRGCP